MLSRVLCIFLALAAVLFGQAANAADKRPTVGLVLGGGGARGAAHIGVLEVLEKHRIKVDCVAGTSMGALVAGSYAGGLTSKMMMEEMAKADWRDMFIDAPDYSEQAYRAKKLSRRFLPGLEMGVTEKGVELPSGVVAGQKIRLFFDYLVRADVGERNISTLAMPLSIIATDIGNGERVVFREGSLTTAMRASMSVPGLLAPVDYKGRKLVDGGLVDNVPIAEVRERCNPDVVIAVNVGSPLLKPEEVGSLLSVSVQMVNILTEQNVTRSLSQLRPNDIYIKPDLEGITAGDFPMYAETAERGRKAAEAAVEQLKKLSSDNDSYAAWWGGIQAVQRNKPVVDEIQIAKMRKVNPAYVERHLRTKPGDRVNTEDLYQDMQRIYGDGDYDRVEYSVLPYRNKTILSVTPIEKPWGPDFMRWGLNLTTDRSDTSTWMVRGAYHKTWLNSLGGEILIAGELGNRPAVLVDFYQPFDARQRVFGEASAVFRREKQGIYQNDNRIAEYKTDVSQFNLALGANLGVYGQARVGWQTQHRSSSLETGSPLLPDGSLNNHGWFATVDIDQFNRRYFPTAGWKGELRYFNSQSNDYGRLDAKLEGAKSFGDYVMIGKFSRTLATSGQLPVYDAATLGGLFNLSAFTDRQVLGGSSAMYGLRGEKIIGRMPLGLRGDIRMGLGVERGRVADRYTETGKDGWTNAATVYLGGDTPMGPIYIGYSHSNSGSSNVYLTIGTP